MPRRRWEFEPDACARFESRMSKSVCQLGNGNNRGRWPTSVASSDRWWTSRWTGWAFALKRQKQSQKDQAQSCFQVWKSSSPPEPDSRFDPASARLDSRGVAIVKGNAFFFTSCSLFRRINLSLILRMKPWGQSFWENAWRWKNWLLVNTNQLWQDEDQALATNAETIPNGLVSCGEARTYDSQNMFSWITSLSFYETHLWTNNLCVCVFFCKPCVFD